MGLLKLQECQDRAGQGQGGKEEVGGVGVKTTCESLEEGVLPHGHGQELKAPRGKDPSGFFAWHP